MAQQQVVRILKLQGNTDSNKTPSIQSLNLAPQSQSDNFHTDSSYLSSGSGKDANFRLVGTGVFEKLLSDPLVGDRVSFLGNTNTKLAVGYATSNPDNIDLKVNGAIRVTGLVHGGSGTEKLCVNDFGVLVTEPSSGACSGYTQEDVNADGLCQSWPASKTQRAESNATGCRVGSYTDIADQTGSSTWTWTCSGVGTGSSVTCSSPRTDLDPGICRKYYGEYTSQPADGSAQKPACISGSYADTVDSDTEYFWSCIDDTTTVCKARKAKQVWAGAGCGACPNGSYTLSSPQDTDAATANGDVESIIVNRNTLSEVFSLKPTKDIRKYTFSACHRTNTNSVVDKDTVFPPVVRAIKKGESGTSLIYEGDAPLCQVIVDEYQQTFSWEWVSYNIPWAMVEK